MGRQRVARAHSLLAAQQRVHPPPVIAEQFIDERQPEVEVKVVEVGGGGWEGRGRGRQRGGGEQGGGGG